MGGISGGNVLGGAVGRLTFMPSSSVSTLLCAAVFVVPLVVANPVAAQVDRKTDAPTVLNQSTQSLIKAGQEPRRKIRFVAVPGSAYTLRMTVSHSIGREYAHRREEPTHSPDVTLTVHVVAVEAPDSGGAIFEATITDVQVSPRTGSERESLDKARAYFDKEKGRKFTFIVRSRGQLACADRLPKDADWMVDYLANDVRNAIQLLCCWVPQEEIGRGAQWKEIEPWKYEGEPGLRNLEFEWVSTEGNKPRMRADISSSFRASAPKKPDGSGEAVFESARQSGFLRYKLAPPCPFPDEVEAKVITEWTGSRIERGSDKGSDKTVACKHVNTTNVRITVKPEALSKPNPAGRK
jgi:hypothetical protein